MSLVNRLLGVAPPSASSVLAIDRIACTGHGICAHILTAAMDLDEWGYPIVLDPHPDRALAAEAVKLCPARALRWIEPHGDPQT
ncbi:putative ferredoxin [Nocardia nova SH22a]|uniref:Putative ferredoxin n=1 Tax=Nocardia nova SH22a TaxID=1415166 RepID=W5TIV3_9NOCA|nr:ferredoxin [Nocardia nova]AHH18873.1 putative ferredoxin [Nocardia nova SH22a]